MREALKDVEASQIEFTTLCSALEEALSASDTNQKLIDDFKRERKKLKDEFCLKMEERESSMCAKSQCQIEELEALLCNFHQKSKEEAKKKSSTLKAGLAEWD